MIEASKKDEETPVPDAFRDAIIAVVEALECGDYTLQNCRARVKPIDTSTARQVSSYIQDYGETLSTLPPDSWNTSVSRWRDGYWEVLVDLYTLESGESDLALLANVFEDLDGYSVEVLGVFVP